MENEALPVLNWTLACYVVHLSYNNNIYCRALMLETIKLYVKAAASLIAQFSKHKIDPRRDNPTTTKFAPCLQAVFAELQRYEQVKNR